MTYNMPSKLPVHLRRVTNMIVQEYAPEKIVLFGSWVWGKPTVDSDVDLLIVKKSKKDRFSREFDLRTRLVGHGFPPMDLLIYTPAELKKRVTIGDFFILDILKRGKILYG